MASTRPYGRSGGPATEGQRRYVVSLAVQAMELDPADAQHHWPRASKRRYADHWAGGMTREQASASIDALQDRIADLQRKGTS